MSNSNHLTLLLGLIAIILASSIYLNTLAFNNFDLAEDACVSSEELNCFEDHNLTKIANGVLGIQMIFHTLFFLGVLMLGLRMKKQYSKNKIIIIENLEKGYNWLVIFTLLGWGLLSFIQNISKQDYYMHFTIFNNQLGVSVIVFLFGLFSIFFLIETIKKNH